MSNIERYQKTVSLIDKANLQDPNQEMLQGSSYPKELLYSNRMSAWLDKLSPDASEELRIAARAQHIERWKIPRDSYPMDRDGYKKWRKELMEYHARRAGELMVEAGYDGQSVQRVQGLIKKDKFKTDAESQMLEDVVCLVFLENYFSDFSKEHLEDKDKLNRIIKKTWNKMSQNARELALGLELGEDVRELISDVLQV